jgi:predicted ATP-grasp superfamily ATP-dependent carboligase
MSEAVGLTLLGVDVRSLAQSFAAQDRPQDRRWSRRPLTGIDCFGDLDARSACDRFVRAERWTSDALADAAIAVARGDASDRGTERADLIISGGLDARPNLLRRLERHYHLRGNGPEIAGLLAEPARWFDLLDRLGVAHPPIALRRPSEPDGWLLKHAASCGGQAVLPAADAGPNLSADAYFQRFVDGSVASVLFIADGRDARIIGFNRLFFETVGGRAFSYAGAVAWAGPPAEQQRTIRGWVDMLTRELGLRGLNGIDLVLPPSAAPMSERAPLLLELNARPTATLELHSERLPGGAVHCHLAACDGRLPSMPIDATAPRAFRGYRVLYARHPVTVARNDWPAWCRDRAAPGSRIDAGEPICSVYGDGDDGVVVEQLLRGRAAAVLRFLATPTKPQPNALTTEAA